MPPRILVDLPADRTHAGTLRLLDSSSSPVAGPFAVLGRADGRTAERHDNVNRSPLLQCGDNPTGSYAVKSVFRVGSLTDYPARTRGIRWDAEGLG